MLLNPLERRWKVCREGITLSPVLEAALVKAEQCQCQASDGLGREGGG